MNKFLIKNPVISEKSTALAVLGKYVFLVEKDTNAIELKKLVQSLYKVNVIKTHIVNVPEKPKRFGRYMTMRPGYKKIIVTLKKGQKIDILPN